MPARSGSFVCLQLQALESKHKSELATHYRVQERELEQLRSTYDRELEKLRSRHKAELEQRVRKSLDIAIHVVLCPRDIVNLFSLLR